MARSESSATEGDLLGACDRCECRRGAAVGNVSLVCHHDSRREIIGKRNPEGIDLGLILNSIGERRLSTELNWARGEEFREPKGRSVDGSSDLNRGISAVSGT